jgi:hypothetical protein
VLTLGAKADLVRFTMNAEEKSMQIENVLVEGVEMTDQHQHATI